MTLTIGRTAFVDGPFDIVHAGDQVAFQLDISPGTVVEAKVMRQQMLGYLEGDVVPVYWDDDSDWDGFYTVESVQIAPVPVYLATGLMPCSVTLQRVGGGYALSWLELVSSADTITGLAYPGVNAFPVHGFPASLVAKPEDNDSYFVTRGDTDIYLYSLNSANFGTTVTPFSKTSQFQVPPAGFYDGAATIEYRVSGTWHELVGDQLPDVAAGDVRISTGVYRLTWSDVGVMTPEVKVSGGSWEAMATMNLEKGDVGQDHTNDGPFTPQTVTVLRNSPEAVTLRFYALGGGAPSTAAYGPFVDIAARRGDHHVSIVVNNILSSGNNLGPTAGTTAATALGSHGLYQTVNDGNGNRYVLASPSSNLTMDTTEGYAYVTAAAVTFEIMLGVELGGSSATTRNTADSIAGQYWCPVGVNQRVISP